VGETILVVDDDPAVRNTLRLLLADEGFEALLAADGQEALERVTERRPDLIILDVMLPQLDGFTFVSRLREGPQGGIPILLLTADGRAGEKAARVGAHAYLAKPFDSERLLNEVRRLVAAH
jgi:CheY-like chemotaxis protein